MPWNRFPGIPIQELNEPLVDLAGYPFVLEPVYYRQGVSDNPRMFARERIAEKLVTAQEKLGGYRFKIWDAWRPRVVQANIYHRYWDEIAAAHPEWGADQLKRSVETFVAQPLDPNRIPPHATGGTVDLTLVDGLGRELNMGTGFDHFGPESASDYFERDPGDGAVRDNRRRLREAMVGQGFRPDDEEWWHYDYGNQLWAATVGEPFAFYGETAPE